MRAYSVIEGRPNSRVVLSCEHASNSVPPEYTGLGVTPEALADHIAWDVGAADLVRAVADTLGAPAVLSGVSRLLVDCNRGQDEASLIVQSSDGVSVPGNLAIDDVERSRRIEAFYRPYHNAVDDVLAHHENAMLMSIHSFTPALRQPAAEPRPFDVGVLFDDYEALAERLGKALEQNALRVRYNQPYSGLSGLIFSARHHGLRHGRPYLELEMNNVRLRTAASIRSVAGYVAGAIGRLLEEE